MNLSTTIDEFGHWLLVADHYTVSADRFHLWNKLGDYHLVSSGTYRFSFSSPDFAQVGSLAWIRAVHTMPNSSNEIVGPARRIYPKPEKIRYEFPIPENLNAIGINKQRLEFKPIFHRYRTSTKIWTIQCEQLIAKSRDSEATTTVVLSNPSYTRDETVNGLWISTFIEEVRDKRGILLSNFEVGRFFQILDNLPISDPVILEAANGKLTVAFTSPALIQPDTLYVRIIY